MGPADVRLYGSIEAARETKLSLRQLYYWVDVLHVVQPRMRQSGLRAFRRFTTDDLRVLSQMRTFVERGYTVQAAVRMVKRIDSAHASPNGLGQGPELAAGPQGL